MPRVDWNDGRSDKLAIPTEARLVEMQKSKNQSEEYVDVDTLNAPIWWNPENGDREIVGVFEKKEIIENRDGQPFPIYYFRLPNDKLLSMTGYTVLRQKMEGIVPGTRLKINYLGRSQSESAALLFKIGIHAGDIGKKAEE